MVHLLLAVLYMRPICPVIIHAATVSLFPFYLPVILMVLMHEMLLKSSGKGV